MQAHQAAVSDEDKVSELLTFDEPRDREHELARRDVLLENLANDLWICAVKQVKSHR